MLRVLIPILVVCLAFFASAPASAQIDVATSKEDVQATGGTPGSWVQQAITRHREFVDARVNAGRGTERAGTNTGTIAATGGATSTGSSGTLGNLGSLLGSLGSLGSLGDLSSLAGSLTGSSSTGTNNTTGSSSSSSNTDALNQLLQLQNSASKLSNAQATDGSSSTSGQDSGSTRVGGGAIARLPKAEDRFQSSGDGTTPTKFTTRWANAMLQSVFSALTFGLQSRDFIDALKNALEPLILPNSNSNSNSNSNANDNSNENSNENDNSGGGIENLNDNSNTNDNGNENSTI